MIGALVLLAGAGVIAFALLGNLTTEYSVAIAFTGGFVVFLGLVVLGPLLARRMSAIVGRPLPTVLGVTGTLARGNAMRNPRRTSATAAALVVGLGLVSLVAIFADSVKTSVRRSLETSVRADYIIAAPQFAGFSPEAARQAGGGAGDQPRRAPAVRRRPDRRSTNETITGANARGIDDVFNLELRRGKLGWPRHGRDDPLGTGRRLLRQGSRRPSDGVVPAASAPRSSRWSGSTRTAG